MKHLILILLAAFSFQLSAVGQPLPFPISAFSRQAVTNTTAADWRTKLAVTNATGGEGLIAGTNVWTGTNRYTLPVLATNTGSVFAGDGSGLTGLVASGYLPLSGGTMSGAILSSASIQGTFLRADFCNSYNNGFSLWTVDTGDGKLHLYGNGASVLHVTDAKLEQRNGTTSQSFDTFHTYTDASNYQGARLAQSAGAVTLSVLTAGTGADNVDIALTPAGTGGVVINGGTALRKVLSAAAALDFGNILATASADLTITVTGAAVGDSVALGPPAAPDASIVFNAFVSAADTVTVRSFNVGAIAVDQASATFRVTIFSF